MAITTPTRLRRVLALAGLLACTTGTHAQTAAQGSPYQSQVQRCMALSQHEPSNAMALATGLLAQPALPPPLQVQALGCLALAQQVNGQGEAAAATVGRLLAAAGGESIPPTLRMTARLQAAGVLVSTADQTQALALMDQVLAESLQRGEAATTLTALLSIAGARSSQLDDPAGALPYFEKAVALSDRLGRRPNMQDAILHYNHAYTLLVLERHAEAEAGFQRALRVARVLPGQQGFIDRIGSHRGEIQRADGHPAQARTLLEAARQAQEHSGDTLGLAVTLQRLARLDLDQGDADAALAPAERSLALAQAGRFVLETRDGLELLAAIHVARGVPAEAARYTRMIQAMERDRDRAAALDTLARMQARVERETAPGGATSDELGQARMARNLALASLLVVLALGGTVLWRLRRRQQVLHTLGHIDPLTGLPNRREADARIAAMFAAAPGSGRRGVLLLVALDTLEAVNHHHGHTAGDEMLVHAARVLADALVPGDLLARREGGTFLVARADTTPEAAFALAEHLRLQLARAPFALADGSTPALTASAGLAAHPFFPVLTQTAADSGDWHSSLRMAELARRAAVQSGGDAWVGLWGLAEGAGAGIDVVHAAPALALARGWIAAGGNRPLAWPVAPGEDALPQTAANDGDTRAAPRDSRM